MLLWTLEELLESPAVIFDILKENWQADKKIVKQKIPYGPVENQYILVFLPDPEIRKPGVVFFIHGGAWRLFNPEAMRFIGYFFARYGFPTVMPGYRLVPNYRFPAQMEDVFNAYLKYLSVSGELGLNSKKTILAGQSAGGELAGLLAFNSKAQRKFGINSDFFRGFLSISGALDISKPSQSPGNEKMYREYAQTEKNRREASPLHHITGREKIPVLCIHGDRDPVVEINRSESFINKIREQRKDLAELRVIKNRHHSDLARVFLNDYEETNLLINWLDDKLS
ncbi:MAG: alpha/beta hydrolase [Spirochaetales bacterium]|nr:alpha/beta hydrolase [Spirochaetales bacterium]